MISVIYVLLLFLFPLPALIFVYWHNLYKKQVRQGLTILATVVFVFMWNDWYCTKELADAGMHNASAIPGSFIIVPYILLGAQIALNWYTTSSSQT
jgi:hypothetical protein